MHWAPVYDPLGRPAFPAQLAALAFVVLLVRLQSYVWPFTRLVGG